MTKSSHTFRRPRGFGCGGRYALSRGMRGVTKLDIITYIFFNGCMVYGIQKKRIRNTETVHQVLQRSELWLWRNWPKCTKICGLAQNDKFWYILFDFSVTITRIFARLGALFLYFEYASFKYHKQNIRSKKHFDFTPYTDFVRAQLLIGRSPQKLRVIL